MAGGTQARLVEIFERNIAEPHIPFKVDVERDIEVLNETDVFEGTITSPTTDQEITFSDISNKIYNWVISNDGSRPVSYKFESNTNPSHTIKKGEVHSWSGLEGTKIYMSNSSGSSVDIRINVSGR